MAAASPTGEIEGRPSRTWARPFGIAQDRRVRARGLLAAVLVLALVACGGDGDSSLPADAPGDDTATSDDESPAAAPDDSGAASSTDDAGTATESVATAEVTIGSETYLFREEGFMASTNCAPARDGMFRALLSLVDDAGQEVERSELDLALLHEGAEADGPESDHVYVRLGHLDEGSLDYVPGWAANAEIAERDGRPGTSQVDSWVIDGNTISGSATFVDGESEAGFLRGDIDSVESVQGDFTVTCGS